MSKLSFLEKSHKYFLDEIPIPSVSEIISPIYNKIYKGINSEVMEKAADKGTKIHRAIEFKSKYNLKKYDKDISEYIKAYENFRSDNPAWKLLHSEYRTYHKALLYGMTIDEIYETNQGIILCDIKTTSTPHLGVWSVQLSAYKSGYENQWNKVSETYALKLSKDGSYQLFKLKDRFSVFLSCLEIYRFEV